jgi:hypothetical protein
VKVSNKLYDTLKFVAQIFLPALGTLYVSVAALWDLPEPVKVSGTILAVDTFLGLLLGLSSNTYNKSGAGLDGAINVIDTPDKTAFQLAIDTAPETLAKQSKVVLKVTNIQPVVTDEAKPDGRHEAL